MSLYTETKYTYNDIAIEPAVISSIRHRHECKVLDENGHLPIFASPMSTVVDLDNFELFNKNHITPILPRNIHLEIRRNFVTNGSWVAFSLSEFKDIFLDSDFNQELVNSKTTMHALIDVANGHMALIYDYVRQAKEIYGSRLEIMVGNIANPLTYIEAAKAGADYVRISVGTGSCCITTTQTGIHYPIASLINETFIIKTQVEDGKHGDVASFPKIVADGGIRNYSDVNKALALGADYVMIGGVFASLIESAAPLLLEDITNNLQPIDDLKFNLKEDDGVVYNEECKSQKYPLQFLYKEMYGMASKCGQIALNGSKTKTSEGIKRRIPVTTNLFKWSNNMIGYLQSAMSYTNIREIKDFNPKHVDCNVISNNSHGVINK